MAQARVVSHTVAPSFPSDVCISYLSAGENIGAWVGYAKAATAIMNRLMWAEGPCPVVCPAGSLLWEQHDHYLNLISSTYRTIGIGIVYAKGETWLTEDLTG